ncbi:MAG: methyltransferase [Anaerolineae bacterium]
MPRTSKDDVPRRSTLDEVVRGIRQAAALKAALELELFTRIAEGHHSLPALLRASGLNDRGARLLLDALVNINLVMRTGFEYLLTPTAEVFLVKGKPSYYGDALLAELAWDARAQTMRSVRSGKPLSTLMVEGHSRLRVARAAATWTDWQVAIQEFESIWDQVGVTADAASPMHMLGLGAESGIRLLPLVQQNPNSRAVVVDNANMLLSLRGILDTLPVRPQYELVEGDWLAAGLPQDLELVLVDSITPFQGMEQNIGILHRAYESLRMSGRIVLRATVADDDRKGPGVVPLFGLDLLIAAGEGDIYTVTEYRGMLEAAGFFEVKLLGDKPGLLTARRVPPPPPPPPSLTVAPDFIPPPETRV